MKTPLHERIAAVKQRQAEIAARLAALQTKQKAADRKLDTRRKIVVGAAVLIEMEKTPRFAAFVRDMLDKAVTRPQDRAAIAELLQMPAEAASLPVNGNVPTPTQPQAAGMTAAGFAVTAREKLTG